MGLQGIARAVGWQAVSITPLEPIEAEPIDSSESSTESKCVERKAHKCLLCHAGETLSQARP